MLPPTFLLNNFSPNMNLNSKIYIAGHQGLVGSALVRQLKLRGYKNLVVRNHKELDLINQQSVIDFFQEEKPEYIILAAAKVGGIYSNNTYPADFIFSNLAIQTNIIHQSFLFGVKRLLFLGSSCIYPRDCPQPIKEEYLLTGVLEKTNQPYAIAKIAGIEMCRSYNRQYGTNNLAVMPTNLFGPNDTYHAENSHVIPAMINKFTKAKDKTDSTVTLWGTGKPRREFLYVDDMAEACILLMNLEDKIFKSLLSYDDEINISSFINIGSGKDLSISELAELVRETVGFKGKIIFDASKPDGTMRKLLDSSRLNKLGWRPALDLKSGLQKTYEDFISMHNQSKNVR